MKETENRFLSRLASKAETTEGASLKLNDEDCARFWAYVRRIKGEQAQPYFMGKLIDCKEPDTHE